MENLKEKQLKQFRLLIKDIMKFDRLESKKEYEEKQKELKDKNEKINIEKFNKNLQKIKDEFYEYQYETQYSDDYEPIDIKYIDDDSKMLIEHYPEYLEKVETRRKEIYDLIHKPL